MSKSILHQNVTVDMSLLVRNIVTLVFLVLVFFIIARLFPFEKFGPDTCNAWCSFRYENPFGAVLNLVMSLFVTLAYIPIIAPLVLMISNVLFNLQKKRKSFMQNGVIMVLLPTLPPLFYFIYINIVLDPNGFLVSKELLAVNQAQTFGIIVLYIFFPLVIAAVIGQIILWIKLRKS